MDNKAKIIFDTKNQLIDSNLKTEIKRIKRTYSPIKHFGFLEMNQRIAMSEAQANEARKLALWELERDLQSTTHPQNSNSGMLSFYKDGSSIYIAPSGKKYKAKLKIGTNSYKLLHYLAGNSVSMFSYSDLIKQINKPRQGASSTDETRTRETIQIIRKEFGLTKDNKKDDLFKVDGKHFGIKCDAEIKHSPQTS